MNGHERSCGSYEPSLSFSPITKQGRFQNTLLPLSTLQSRTSTAQIFFKTECTLGLFVHVALKKEFQQAFHNDEALMSPEETVTSLYKHSTPSLSTLWVCNRLIVCQLPHMNQVTKRYRSVPRYRIKCRGFQIPVITAKQYLDRVNYILQMSSQAASKEFSQFQFR